jgi:hypothetical protein
VGGLHGWTGHPGRPLQVGKHDRPSGAVTCAAAAGTASPVMVSDWAHLGGRCPGRPRHRRALPLARRVGRAHDSGRPPAGPPRHRAPYGDRGTAGGLTPPLGAHRVDVTSSCDGLRPTALVRGRGLHSRRCPGAGWRNCRVSTIATTVSSAGYRCEGPDDPGGTLLGEVRVPSLQTSEMSHSAPTTLARALPRHRCRRV